MNLTQSKEKVSLSFTMPASLRNSAADTPRHRLAERTSFFAKVENWEINLQKQGYRDC